MKHRTLRQLAIPVLALSLLLAACGDDDDDPGASGDSTTSTSEGAASGLSDDQALAAATTYADMVSAAYVATAASAKEMQTAIQTFVDDPTDAQIQHAGSSGSGPDGAECERKGDDQPREPVRAELGEAALWVVDVHFAHLSG